MYDENIWAFPHILGSPSLYMTLHPIPSEFPDMWGILYFLFYQWCIGLPAGSTFRLSSWLSVSFQYILHSSYFSCLHCYSKTLSHEALDKSVGKKHCLIVNFQNVFPAPVPLTVFKFCTLCQCKTLFEKSDTVKCIQFSAKYADKREWWQLPS